MLTYKDKRYKWNFKKFIKNAWYGSKLNNTL